MYLGLLLVLLPLALGYCIPCRSTALLHALNITVLRMVYLILFLMGISLAFVDDLVAQTLEFTIEEVNNDREVANNAKNKQVVLSLYEKGIFDIKDAINQVADRLNISKHTVYLYIRQFKNGE